MAIVTFVDETTAGDRGAGWGLEVAEERLTVRELIRRRVFREVAEYNARTPRVFQGLVQPRDAERVLDGYGVPPAGSTPGRRRSWRSPPSRATASWCWWGTVRSPTRTRRWS